MKTLEEWFFEEEKKLRESLCPEAVPMKIIPTLVRMAWEYPHHKKIMNHGCHDCKYYSYQIARCKDCTMLSNWKEK